MNLVFNELSCFPLPDDDFTAKRHFLNIIEVYEHAKSKHGFTHFVFPSDVSQLPATRDKNLIGLIRDLEHGKERDTILSIISRRPFATDILAAQAKDLSRYYYQNDALGIPETYCTGLAMAYLKETLCASLPNAPVWDEPRIEFNRIINDQMETEIVSVSNVSKKEHFNKDEIRAFVEDLGEIKLMKTDRDSSEKPIRLRDDHGKDKLLDFSRKVIRSEYVTAVINSLPFNPNHVNLIKDVTPDGKIELVLYWEDKGIGIIIQTTGKNYRETKAIAELLRKEFDR